MLWRREAPPEHPWKSSEEHSEEDGEGKVCNFYIALTTYANPLAQMKAGVLYFKQKRLLSYPVVVMAHQKSF